MFYGIETSVVNITKTSFLVIDRTTKYLKEFAPGVCTIKLFTFVIYEFS
jgi:hypothetical protein